MFALSMAYSDLFGIAIFSFDLKVRNMGSKIGHNIDCSVLEVGHGLRFSGLKWM